jgi:hypothetical protein
MQAWVATDWTWLLVQQSLSHHDAPPPLQASTRHGLQIWAWLRTCTHQGCARSKHMRGTPFYQPEQELLKQAVPMSARGNNSKKARLEEYCYTTAVDVFMFACTFLEAATFFTPEVGKVLIAQGLAKPARNHHDWSTHLAKVWGKSFGDSGARDRADSAKEALRDAAAAQFGIGKTQHELKYVTMLIEALLGGVVKQSSQRSSMQQILTSLKRLLTALH